MKKGCKLCFVPKSVELALEHQEMLVLSHQYMRKQD